MTTWLRLWGGVPCAPCLAYAAAILPALAEESANASALAGEFLDRVIAYHDGDHVDPGGELPALCGPCMIGPHSDCTGWYPLEIAPGHVEPHVCGCTRPAFEHPLREAWDTGKDQL